MLYIAEIAKGKVGEFCAADFPTQEAWAGEFVRLWGGKIVRAPGLDELGGTAYHYHLDGTPPRYFLVREEVQPLASPLSSKAAQGIQTAEGFLGTASS